MKLSLEKIAAVCHEVNRCYALLLGDDSHVKWEDAPEWQKESALIGVKYRLDNPGVSPEDSHNCWLETKLADGWKYGPVKDPEAKEHPCIMAYDELPLEEQIKDELFTSIIDALK